MIGPWNRPLVRVTHLPSGESVTVEVSDRRRFNDARLLALRILRSRLAAGPQQSRLVRSYEPDGRGWLADPLNPGEWLQ
jgi:protein subunit release factor A